MPGTDAWVWPNNIYVSAKVIGGAVWEVFGRLAWMDRQRFAMTATGTELERHGLEYGITRKGASYSQGNLIVTSDIYPLTIPVGSPIIRSDGAVFNAVTSQDIGKYTLTATVQVIAAVAGKAGNTTYGAPFTCALSGVTGAVVDQSGLGLGADLETDDQLRARILARKRYPPMGGAEYDYMEWGLSIPGVTRVFVEGNAYGRGTVGVWFLMDDTYPAGIPQTADVLNMQSVINALAPVTAKVIVAAPVADCMDIVINNLSPDTQATRISAGAEIASMFRKMTSPGLPNTPFTLYQSWISQAVGNATGQRSHTITAPASDIAYTGGVMPCLRSVSFTKIPAS
jgi:uncharacterized phage protein gp47/JayE